VLRTRCRAGARAAGERASGRAQEHGRVGDRPSASEPTISRKAGDRPPHQPHAAQIAG
jgi:hypothetical protein